MNSKILIVSPEIPFPIFKGNQNRIHFSVKALIELGHCVDLLILNSSQPDVKSVTKEKELTSIYPGINRVKIVRHPKFNSNYFQYLVDFLYEKFSSDSICTPKNCPLKFRRIARKMIVSNDYDDVLINYIKFYKCVPSSFKKSSYIDMHDIHSKIVSKSASKADFNKLIHEELKLLNYFKYVISINQNETNFIKNFIDDEKLYTLPVCTNSVRVSNEFFDYDLGFLGSSSFFNMEGVIKFNAKVFPKLKRLFPNIKILIAGDVSNSAAFKVLDKKHYTIVGRLESVDDFYHKIKVFISPIINGAGMKVKNIEAMSYGKAIVATEFSMDGIAFDNKVSCMVSRDWDSFANDLVTVLRDDFLRKKLENSALSFHRSYHSINIKKDFYKNILSDKKRKDNVSSPGEFLEKQLNKKAFVDFPKTETKPRAKALIFGTDAYELSSFMLNLANKFKKLNIYSEFFKMDTINTSQFLNSGYLVSSIREISKKFDRKKIKQNLSQYIYNNEIISSIYYKGVDITPDIKIYNKMFPEHFNDGRTINVLAHAFIILDSLDEIVKKNNPTFLVGWNGNGPHLICLVKIIAKIHQVPVLHVERGLLPKSLVLEPNIVNAGSTFSGSYLPLINEVERKVAKEFLSKYRSKFSTIVKDNGKCLNRNSDFKKIFNLKFNNGFILFPMQIEGDSNIILNSPYFKSMYDVLTLLSKVALENKIDIICRPHPENKTSSEAIEEFCNRIDHCHLVSDYDLKSLLIYAKTTVVINSTVGLESLLLGRPTICLGNSFYSNKQLTYDCANFDNINLSVKEILSENNSNFTNKDELLYRLVYLLIAKYLIFFDVDINDSNKISNLLNLAGVRNFPESYSKSPPKLAQKVSSYINRKTKVLEKLSKKESINVLYLLKGGTKRYYNGSKKPTISQNILRNELIDHFGKKEIKFRTKYRKNFKPDIIIINEKDLNIYNYDGDYFNEFLDYIFNE